METDNFDKQIKNRLEQRTLKPSAKSWEQLRSKLDKKEKKTTPMYWLFGVAASFAGGILLMTLVFNKPTNQLQIQLPANANNTVIDKEENLQEKETFPIQEVLIAEEVTKVENQKINVAVQSVSESKPEVAFEVEKNGYSEEKILPFLLEEESVIAVSETKFYNSNAEVDSLLQQALADIAERKAQATDAISANQLLEEVEGEVERSFRERVFELLKDGLNISRDALANRNQ